MNTAKGTTPAWMRPFKVAIDVSFLREGFHDINVLEVLTRTKMAQSKAEAKRLVEQGILWLDNGVGEFIWSRVTKVKPEAGKFLLIERGDALCVGRIIDEAICHRIEFV